MMKKILLGLSQQDYKLTPGILNLIDFVEIKKIDNKHISEAVSYNLPISLHLQRIFGPTTSPSKKDFIPTLTSNKIKQIFKKLLPNTLWYSTHLHSSTEKWRSFNQGKHSIAITKPFPREFLKKRISKNLVRAKKLFSRELLVENMDYNNYKAAKGLFEHICETKFISEIIKKTNCGFLLDLGHAVVSAKNLGYPNVNKYLSELPIEKVVEIHLTRPRVYKQIAKDRHLPITFNEIKLALSLEKRLNNLKAINLEVFKNKRKTIKQLKLIKERFINK